MYSSSATLFRSRRGPGVEARSAPGRDAYAVFCLRFVPMCIHLPLSALIRMCGMYTLTCSILKRKFHEAAGRASFSHTLFRHSLWTDAFIFELSYLVLCSLQVLGVRWCLPLVVPLPGRVACLASPTPTCARLLELVRGSKVGHLLF